jgi:ribosome modulation factor
VRSPDNRFHSSRRNYVSRDQELHEAAIIFRLAARTPEEEAYFRGYGSGIARRLAGGPGADGYETRAFEMLQSAADAPTRALGTGYRDGLAGETLRDRRSGA